MKYEDVRKELVDKKELFTSKELAWMALRLGLIVIGCIFAIGFLTSTVLGNTVSLIVALGGILLYSSLLEYITESSSRAKSFQKKSKYLWIVPYIVTVIEFLIFHFLKFV